MNYLSYRLTDEELTLAAKQRKFSSESIAIAKALMVDRVSAIQIAKNFEKSRHRIYQIRNEFWAAYLEAKSIPSHWKQVTAFAPTELIDEFLIKVEQAKKRL